MGVRAVPFGPELMDAFSDFSAATWKHQQTPEWLAWRYLKCPSLRGILVMEDGRCVASAFAFERPWLVDGERRTVLETVDWATLPELRGSGVGIRALQRLSRAQEPLLAIGGSADTNVLVERMGYAPVGEILGFVLPVGSARLAEKLHQDRGVPKPLGRVAGWLATRSVFRAPLMRRPAGGQVVPVAFLDEQATRLHAQGSYHRASALPDDSWLRWVRSDRENGVWVSLEFRVHGALVGYAVGRVWHRNGRVEALLADAFSSEADPSLWSWVVGELTTRLRGFSPGVIWARAASPRLQQALIANRFQVASRHVLRVHAGQSGSLTGPLHVAALSSDQALLPYESGVITA